MLDESFKHASPRPWTYHNERFTRAGDWIEDAAGNIVVENVGHIDGPLICHCVNHYDQLMEGLQIGARALENVMDDNARIREILGMPQP